MKNKQGFTLIELLAVIVILAIIALIATPIILGVIDKAKIGSVEQSANGYIGAIENLVVVSQLTGENVMEDGVYDLPITNVEVKGSKPTSGWVKLEKGIVTDYSMIIDEYTVTKGSTTVKNGEVKEKPDSTNVVYANGTAIYYNPVSGEVCTDYVESNSAGVNKTGCMKWYIFNDSSESTTVNMILDHNTTATIAWYSSGKNVAYEESNIKPEVDKLVSESGWVVTPRLISAEEIAQITGKTDFDSTSSSSMYYFDSNSTTQTTKNQGTSKYAWLYDYTNNCTYYGCNIVYQNTYGYWTSTTYGTAGSGGGMWRVYCSGQLLITSASDTYHGVRPVITISKSILS